jgi:hypothetical protein
VGHLEEVEEVELRLKEGELEEEGRQKDQVLVDWLMWEQKERSKVHLGK